MASFLSIFGRLLAWLKSLLDKLPPAPTPTPTPNPVPVPTPPPTPPPPTPPSSVFTRHGNVITLDMNTVPRSMGMAGFSGSDNALYYALAHVYAFGSGAVMPDDSAGSLVHLNTQRAQISSWFDAEVMKVSASLKADSNLSVVAISNDGRDRCGFRLGPAIVQRLQSFGSRVQLGQVLPPEQY